MRVNEEGLLDITSEIIEIEFKTSQLGVSVKPGKNSIGLIVSDIKDAAPTIARRKLYKDSQIIAVNGENIEHMRFNDAVNHFNELNLPIKIQFRLPQAIHHDQWFERRIDLSTNNKSNSQSTEIEIDPDNNHDNKTTSKSTDIINYAFDISAAIISLLDLITDIIVTVQYYYAAKYEFFIPSLLILMSAQISYCVLFKNRYRFPQDKNNQLQTSPTKELIYFLCLLPLSPILSFVFYFASEPDALLTKFLENKFGLQLMFAKNNNDSDENEPKMIKWMKKKIGSHIGFIAESIIESFPQSVIQMTAMVIYKKVNIFSIISILLSLLSISTKSFVICVAS
eukprot:489940_1